jgi:hypothetical protein
MATYFSGLRVKLVRPVHPESFGMEGRFLRYRDTPKGTVCIGGILSFDCNCVVQWDTIVGESIQHTDQLEPILPEGMQPAEWEDTAWNPDMIKETADV